MTSRIHFLLDPSQVNLDHRWPQEEKRIRELTEDFSIHIIRGRGHAEHLTREIQRSDAQLLVCVGGDRIVHEVVNALSEQSSLQVALHHELHSGNLKNHRPAARTFYEFLSDYLKGDQRSVAIDLGVAKFLGSYGERVRRYFFSHVSFGLPAAVLHRLPEPSNRMKAFRVLVRVVPFYRPPALKIEVNDNLQAPDFFLGGFIQNLPWAARGIRVAKDAKTDDALLDFTTLRKSSWPRTIWAAARLLFQDELSGQFLKRESIRRLKIESTTSQRNVRIEVDGESWGHLPLEIEKIATRLKLLE